MFLERNHSFSTSRSGAVPLTAMESTARGALADGLILPKPIGRKPVPTKSQSLTHLCPHCGTGVEALPSSSSACRDARKDSLAEPLPDSDAVREENAEKQSEIEQLKQEVVRLSGKASAASDKLADYEDEIRALRAQAQQQSSPSSTLLPPIDTPPRPRTAEEARPTPVGLPSLPEAAPLTTSPKQMVLQSTLRRATSMRFSNFLTRKTSSQSEPSTPEAAVVDPQAALQSERSQRIAAESKLTQVNTELEELSATLFQQANEMVASERRDRAEAEQRAEKRNAHQDKQLQQQGAQIRKLQDRIKVLEERDKERSKRLEKLEKGMQRVGRIRNLLVAGPDTGRLG